MTNVHIDRVMNVCFFFSYSETGGGCCNAERVSKSSIFLSHGEPTLAVSLPPFTREPGSEAASLMSEKLLRRPSVLDVCPLRWLNLMPRRGLGILDSWIMESPALPRSWGRGLSCCRVSEVASSLGARDHRLLSE